MTNIYYVRHGQSEGNVAGVASGAEHDCDLTEEGREQARKAGAQLKDSQADLIVCSPMKRAVETAQIIAACIDYDPSRIVIRPEFVERTMGWYSEKPMDEYIAGSRAKQPRPGLETTDSMLARTTLGLEWVASQKAQNVIVVAHGGIGRAVKAYDQKLHHSKMYHMDGMDNASIYEFSI